jgi:hypothetical protein
MALKGDPGMAGLTTTLCSGPLEQIRVIDEYTGLNFRVYSDLQPQPRTAIPVTCPKISRSTSQNSSLGVALVGRVGAQWLATESTQVKVWAGTEKQQ